MTPQRWAQIKEIITNALERSDSSRTAYLDDACGSDRDLRREVERLLREYGDGSVFESPRFAPDLVGRTFSHYRVAEKLGEGGMGVVYKAEDTKLDRTVALKFLAPHVLLSEEHKARFIQEAKAAAAIHHPNICTVHAIEDINGHLFLAMAYIDGPTLKQKVAERPLKIEEALHVATEAAQGLKAAHKRGIAHRDIKSANIMLDAEDRPVIMDFGLAQLAGGTRITRAGTTLGTPAYMSPEQVRGEETDHRTDLWSLGVVLYELVTGRQPFRGDHQTALSAAIQSEEPEPVTALRAGVPLELDWILGKALAKNPADRYQSAADLIVDLRGLGRKIESGASGRAPTAAPANREELNGKLRSTRLRLRLATVSAIVLALILFGVAFEDMSRETPLRRFAFTSPMGS
ncbi:MAG: serine/threonine protein kinase, partial [bacterium]|nr:serine/threonine protein kinase [bacterium]